MAPRITIIGGGSYQWVPKLLIDIANTPALHEAEIVLEDIDPEPLPRMVALVEHVAEVRGIGLTARATTDQQTALDGADFVVVNLSTGGFESMRFDLEIPARYGIRQSVGDSVGPGGIVRALRNIPVFVGISRDMEECCPDAWMLNLTNPMTTICRTVTKTSRIRTVGLCHEVTNAQFSLSLLLDRSFLEFTPTVAGVNHLPVITALDVGGDDGLALLSDLLDHEAEHAAEPLDSEFAEHLEVRGSGADGRVTRGDLLDANRVKLELFRRTGVLPAAGDRHLVEFFAGFLTEASEWGARWGVHLTTIEERERGQQGHVAEFERLLAQPRVTDLPSGEMLAPVIMCLQERLPGWFPLNVPNHGQVADLPEEVVVESMCVVDGDGIRGRDVATVPPLLADTLRRVSDAQELTVEAGLTGDRDRVVDAMLVDPLAGRIDYDAVRAMSDEMLAATKRWLPQFA
jgi:alpha-galactosidase/6-phospho-beta-glucosidase family protein